MCPQSDPRNDPPRSEMATASKEPPTQDLMTQELMTQELMTQELTPKELTKSTMTRPVAAKEVAAAPASGGSVRVEIFDQIYNLRGSDADYIIQLADYVDGKMRAVSEQTATVDSVRLAVLAALNIADEYHLLKRRLETPSPEARQRTTKLASALDEVLEDTRRAG